MPAWKRRKTVVSEAADPLEGLTNISIDNMQTLDLKHSKSKIRKAVSRPKSTIIKKLDLDKI